ncbi:hypothetical protein RRG08_017308 [Elysia crispata]|uniref:Uncharacterized protein n=1 Tax=Elysia crispata TaxID=231223 RepID=A0AAE1D450_9GAST|nr:hypothetical protein RRG08_017308 [Elysia crispata]
MFQITHWSTLRTRLLFLWSILLLIEDLLAIRGMQNLETPACNFSEFLQPHSPGGGEWTYEYDGYIHVAKVNGGVYTMCSNSPKRSYQEDDKICHKQKQTCYKQYGPDLYVVELGPSSRPSYQCFRFYRRGQAVVQLALSDRLYDPRGICNLTLRFDHAPWISVKLYKTAIAPCPFNGGFNFQDIVEFSRDHTPNSLCSSSERAPLRLESDCVQSEGFKMTFSDDECIPTGSHFGKTQRLLCMASWMQDGNGFAMLRKENERAFYCSRIIFSANNEVKEMIIYLSWMCYRDTDFNSHNLRLSIHTNYVRFRSPVKTIISLPCRANEQTCSPVCKNGQCTRTCSQCLNSTGVPTEMDPDVVGSWLIGGPHGTSTMEVRGYILHSSGH